MRRPRPNAQRLDLHALRVGIAAPGLDTRAWVEWARVDDDPDAVVWDRELGWLCDVHLESGSSAGEGPLSATVLGAGGGGMGYHAPVHPGDRVLVAIVSGDPNADVVVIGRDHDVDDCTAPTTVNGDSIVETGASAGQVAADETHIAAFGDEDLDAEFRGVRLGADSVKVPSPDVRLGTEDADEHAILGDARNGDVGAFLDAMTSFCTSVAATGLPGIANAATQLQTAVVTLRAQLPSHLAQRVKVA
jgi:hypothetical protein